MQGSGGRCTNNAKRIPKREAVADQGRVQTNIHPTMESMEKIQQIQKGHLNIQTNRCTSPPISKIP